MKKYFALSLLMIALAYAAITYASESYKWSFSLIPDTQVININRREVVNFHFSNDGGNRDKIQSSIDSLILKIVNIKQNKIEYEGSFKSVGDLLKYQFRPTETGPYRIIASIKMRSGYIFDSSSIITAVDIPGISPLPPTVETYEKGKIFDISIQIPQRIYNALDLVFLIDKSGSMTNKIRTMRDSAQSIFSSLLKSHVGEVQASVLFFSDAVKTNNMHVGNLEVAITRTSNNKDFSNLPTNTRGGYEFQYYALYQANNNKSLWRKDSIRHLVLMTDEPDNVYCTESDSKCANFDTHRKVEWSTGGSLSVDDIINSLSNSGITVSVIYDKVDGDNCYGNVLRKYLGGKFAGAYLHKNSSSIEPVVQGLSSAMESLKNSTTLSLEIMDDQKSFIQTIKPLSPEDCIDGNTGRYKYSCLINKGFNEIKYRVTMSQSPLKSSMHTFLLAIRTDSGALVSVKPVTLTR